MDVQRLAQARDVAVRVAGLYRTVVSVRPEARETILAELQRGPGLSAELSRNPPAADLPVMATPIQRLFWVNMNLVPVGGPRSRWNDMLWLGGPDWHVIVAGLRMPDGEWLNVRVAVEPLRPWHSPTFLWAFLLMTAAAACLTLWAVRRLTAPVATLAAAAERLGRDVNAPPLPEDGPLEVAT